MALSNLEVRRVVEELKSLEGKYFEKMTFVQKETFILKFRGINVLIRLPDTVHVTKYQYESKHATGFMMFVRKQLKNTKIRSVSQSGMDRVIIFEFENDWKIVIELFATGNIILVNELGNTRYALRYETWKDRVIRPNKPYSFPTNTKLDPFEMDQKEFDKLFGKKDAIRSMVAGINVSGRYLEEACVLARVDKNSKKVDTELLFNAVKEVINHKSASGIQGEPVLFKMKNREEEFMEKESFMDALDDYYADNIPHGEELNVEKPKFTKIEKMEHRLREQMDAVLQLERDKKEYLGKAEWMYANLHVLNQIMRKIEEERSAGRTWEEINELLAPAARVDPKTQKLTVVMDLQ